MATYSKKTISGREALDGNSYDHCAFLAVELTYAGGPLPNFVNCTFDDATFTFTDEAARTLSFLRGMANRSSGLRPVVDGLMPELAS